jgi:hypothetical protein
MDWHSHVDALGRMNPLICLNLVTSENLRTFNAEINFMLTFIIYHLIEMKGFGGLFV